LVRGEGLKKEVDSASSHVFMEEFLHITDDIPVGEEETLWSDRSSLDNTKHSCSSSSSTTALHPHSPHLLFLLFLILHTCSF